MLRDSAQALKLTFYKKALMITKKSFLISAFSLLIAILIIN